MEDIFEPIQGCLGLKINFSAGLVWHLFLKKLISELDEYLILLQRYVSTFYFPRKSIRSDFLHKKNENDIPG